MKIEITQEPKPDLEKQYKDISDEINLRQNYIAARREYARYISTGTSTEAGRFMREAEIHNSLADIDQYILDYLHEARSAILVKLATEKQPDPKDE